MKSIPRLVGDQLPVTDASRANKVFTIVKNPNNLENDRPIESISPETMGKWLGLVKVMNRVPSTTDITDSSTNNNYPVGCIWINTSSNPNSAYMLTQVANNSATWVRLTDVVEELSITNWNDIPGTLEHYFITSYAGTTQNAPKSIDTIWLVRLMTNLNRTIRIMFATNLKDTAENYARSYLNGSWTAWNLTHAQHY